MQRGSGPLVHQLFAIVRANIMVFGWLTSESDKGLDNGFYAANVAPLSAEKNEYQIADVAAAADFAAVYVINPSPVDTLYNALKLADIAASSMDCQFLLDSSHKLEDIRQEDLWWHRKSDYIQQSEDDLIATLNAGGLDFLANDIKKLWAAEQPEQSIKNYLQSVSETQLQSAVDLRHLVCGEQDITYHDTVRIFLSGPTGAGKTALCQLLLAANRQFNQLPLTVWDYGEQGILHHSGKASADENCIYIVVVDSRYEQSPDAWLNQISVVTQNRAEVLLVSNCFDGDQNRANKINRQSLIRRYPALLKQSSFFDFNCLCAKAPDLCGFLNELSQLVLRNRCKIFDQTQQAIKLLEDSFSKQRVINKEWLIRLLQQQFSQASADEIERLQLKLYQLGYLTLIDSDYQSLYLPPQWVFYQVDQLLNHDKVQQQQGQITREDMAMIVADQIGVSELAQFLVQQQIAVVLAGSDAHHPRYFLADAAPIEEPLSVAQWLSASEQSGQLPAIVMTYELPYLPGGIRGKLLSQLMQDKAVDICPQTDVWRDGLMVRLVAETACMILEYQTLERCVVLTLLGHNKGVAALLDSVDKALETSCNRDVIGYPIYGKNLVGQSIIQARISDIHQLTHCRFDVKTSFILADSCPLIEDAPGSDTLGEEVIGGFAMDTEAIGDAEPMSDEQKAAMCEVIDESFKKVIDGAFKNNTLRILALASAREALDATQGYFPQTDDIHTASLLNILWQGIKEVDFSVSQQERAEKYLPPVIATVLTILAGI